MSNRLPNSVDVWRMVTAKRVFEGSIAFDAMPRLKTLLADVAGQCNYEIGFDRNGQDQAFLDLSVTANLPLVCQRTLQHFDLPVVISQRLGLIRHEREEAALLEGYEPVLVPADGFLQVADIVEDELILAVPMVPMSDDGLLEDQVIWQDADAAEEPATTNPFAALSRLKKQD